MKFSVSFISLITISISSMTFSQSSKPVPGCSACIYYGATKEDCQLPTVPPSDLPQNCTSYIYIDVRPDESFNIGFGYAEINNKEYFSSLLSSGKTTFFYYNRITIDDWLPALENGAANGKKEIANLKVFLEPYKNISGLIIGGLNLVVGTTNGDSITKDFIAYLDEMKACFPDYSIGLDIYGPLISQYFEDPNPPVYLDFCALDSYIDFFVIDVFRLNDCTEEFKVGGDIPVNGTAPYTIDKVRGYVTKLGVSKKKIYFMYRTGPGTLATSDDGVCKRTNAMVCASPTLDGYCSDNTQSYYDKGAYAKQYGAGFIGAGIDLHDDPYGCCQCGGPYPGFHDMLAGFHGDPVPPACPLLDK